MWISEEERRYRAGQEEAWRRYRAWKKGNRRGPKPKKLKNERKQAAERCRKFLEKFWHDFTLCVTKQQRMDLIKRAVRLEWWVSERLRMQIRREYLKKKHHLLNIKDVECGICLAAKADEKHHIVMVCYGGINENENLIAICQGCHNEIHPWMVGE